MSEIIKDFLSTPTAIAIASSTNATPIVITATNHGLTNGRVVVIADHLVNTNANGRWEIAGVTASTFQLRGSVGNGVGGATGTVTDEQGAIRRSGVGTTNGPNLTPAIIDGKFGSKLSGFLEVLTVTGTSPTLNVKIQYSYDGTNFTDLTSGAFTQLTAAGRAELNGVAIAGVPRVFRYVDTLGGTTPVFTFVVKLWLHE